MPDEPLRGRGLAAALLLVASIAHAQPASAPAAVPTRALTCVACHGPAGNSQLPTIPSLAGQPKIFIENQLVLIREGLRDVPEMKGLMQGVSDAEIVQLAEYFAGQKPLPVATAPRRDDVFRRGQQLADKALCGTCHLPDYAGRQQVPRLAGQHEAFLLQSLKQFRDRPGPGRDTIMSATLLGMKDDDLADLAHYLAQLR